MAVTTPKALAVFARDPGTTVTAGPLTVTFGESGGTVWVASLDGQPVTESGRLLVAHLTDAKNAGMRFAEREMVTLQDWGAAPHLVRAGTAEISLARPSVGLTAYCLDITGKRIGQTDLATDGDALLLTTNTRGPDGACLYYELAR